MRAREFITEQHELAPEQAATLQNTYEIPGLPVSNPYQTYRVGVAIAREISNLGNPDDINPYRLPWSAETAMGPYAVVVGQGFDVKPFIDKALAMTKTPDGVRVVGTEGEQEPALVNKKSPVNGFKGYKTKRGK